MGVSAGYKQTEIGVIPKDWEVQMLKQISPSQSVGLVINPSTYFDSSGSIPMLVGSNITPNRIDWSKSNRITEESNLSLPASRIYEGDLVVVRVGEPGITAVVPAQLDGCNCASMMIVRKSERFVSEWLCAIFNSAIGESRIGGVQYGTAQKCFNISDAVEFKFPVPPLPEQRAIATTLSDVDAALEGTLQLIAKKRNLKQAAMQTLLTGQTRLPGYSGEWQVKRLGEVVGIRNAKVNTLGADVAAFCIELEQIGQNTGQIESHLDARNRQSSKYFFKRGDVLFGRLRPYLRKYWWADRDGVCSTEIWPLIPLGGLLTTEYLFQAVQTDAFIEAANSSYGTHMPRCDWGALKRYDMPMPIDPVEQTAIATILSDMDNEIAGLTARADKTRLLKQAMMQELLTGRTRLPIPEDANA